MANSVTRWTGPARLFDALRRCTGEAWGAGRYVSEVHTRAGSEAAAVGRAFARRRSIAGDRARSSGLCWRGGADRAVDANAGGRARTIPGPGHQLAPDAQDHVLDAGHSDVDPERAEAVEYRVRTGRRAGRFSHARRRDAGPAAKKFLQHLFGCHRGHGRRAGHDEALWRADHSAWHAVCER